METSTWRMDPIRCGWPAVRDLLSSPLETLFASLRFLTALSTSSPASKIISVNDALGRKAPLSLDPISSRKPSVKASACAWEMFMQINRESRDLFLEAYERGRTC